MTSYIHTFVIELSSRCSEGCDFCYSISWDSIKRKPRKKELNFMQWKKVLRNIKKAHANSVNFSGGEPTFHSKFIKILNYAKKLGFYTIVSTNGSTFRNYMIKNSLVKYADCIALSIHGPKEVHDSIKKRVGSYQTVIESYNYYSKKGKHLKINSVACRKNYSKLIELGKILHIEKNPNVQWKISQVIPRGSGLKNKKKIIISDKRFAELKKKISKKYNESYNKNRITFREDDSKLYKHSFVPYIIIDSEGEIYMPIGEKDFKLHVSVLDKDIISDIKKKIKNHENIFAALKKNHYKYYGIYSEFKQISEKHTI